MGFPTRLKLARESTNRNTKHQLFLDHVESIPRNLHHDAPSTSPDHPLLRLYA